MKKYLGTITILIKDRQANVDALQRLLTDHGHYIHARLGINLEPTCLAHCLGFITLVVEGTDKEIEALKEKIAALEGMTVKSLIVTE
jgi:metal-responsive CopG/Arc/MetJ family transcriptional regulator